MASSNQVTVGFDRYAKMKPNSGKPDYNDPKILEQAFQQAYERGYLEGCIDGKREGFQDGLRWATGK